MAEVEGGSEWGGIGAGAPCQTTAAGRPAGSGTPGLAASNARIFAQVAALVCGWVRGRRGWG